MPFFFPSIPGPQGEPGASNALVLYLDTAGGAYTGTPIAGTLEKNPNTGAKTTITGTVTTTPALVARFTSPAGYLDRDRIDTGNWLLHLYSFGAVQAYFYFDLSYVDADGTSNKTLIESGLGGATFLTASQQMAGNSLYIPTVPLPDQTKRLVLDLYVGSTSGNRSFTFEFRNATETHIHSTLPSDEFDAMVEYLGNSSNTLDVVPRNVTAACTAPDGTGRVSLSYFTPPRRITIDEITMGNTATAAAGVVGARMGIYEVVGTTLTLLARTANDATLFTLTNALYTRTLATAGGYPATLTLDPQKRYAVGLFLDAATLPTLVNSGPILQAFMALEPRLAGQVTGQVDLPATIISVSGLNRINWARLS